MTAGRDPARADVEGSEGWLTATQVAEALGVKRATVYAYVSRGILHRRLALDGRTSLYDRHQVEDLRRGSGGPAAGELRTVLATAITRVADRSLVLRGRNLVSLVEAGAGFEEVADLIWQVDNRDFWTSPSGASTGSAVVDRPLPMLDRFRIAVAVAAASDPHRSDLSPAVVGRTAPHIIRAMTEALPPVGDVVPASPEPDERAPMVVARWLWPRLTSQPIDVHHLRALDTALALLADHGLATSTFAVRVAASVRADPYASVGVGLGAVDAPLHGAASGLVHRRLAAMAGEDRDVGVPGPAFMSTPGFGHTIYRSEDPRFAILHAALRVGWPDDPRHDVLSEYRRTVGARTESAANVDLALGHLTWLAGMAAEAGEAIFAVARCAGWIGHAMEEYAERPLRLRPRGHYVGPLPVDDGVNLESRPE